MISSRARGSSITWIMRSRCPAPAWLCHIVSRTCGLSSRHGWTWMWTSMLRIHRGRFVQKRQNVDNTRRLPMRINDPCGNRRLRRTTAGVTVLGCALFLASCDERPFSSPAPAGGVKAQTVSAGPFTFENFPLGAVPGTVCPGSSACTNGAAEPAIRADNTGTFYVSSELGLSAGTLAWKSTDGGLHYTALESPNQLSQAAGGVGPGGGDTDLSTAPQANASGIHNVYVASLSLANVTVSTSQDGGKTWR